MSILDAKSEAGFAADHVHVEMADGQTRGKFIFVSFCSQGLRFRRNSGYEKVSRESPRGRVQRNGFVFEVEDSEVRGSKRQMDLVVGTAANSILSRLTPSDSTKRKPAVRLEHVRSVLTA